MDLRADVGIGFYSVFGKEPLPPLIRHGPKGRDSFPRGSL